MAIKVTTAADTMQVDTICATIYSQPGLGKTSLAFTASRPLLLDFDKGAYRAVHRLDTVQVSDWTDVAGITKADVAEYDTIILDTVGKALESLTANILAGNSKLGYGGSLNQQGWGQLATRFGAFLRMIRSFGKDVILVAHMDEQKDGDNIKERLKVPGGSKDTIHGDTDAMARISIHNRERFLIFNPTEASFGKDPARLGAVPIPDAESAAFPTFMADTIASIKESLNALSEEQKERHGEVQWFKDNVPNMMDADAINEVLGRAKRAGRDVAKMVAERAADLGLEFDADPDVRRYIYLEETQPEEDAPEGEDTPAQIAAE